MSPAVTLHMAQVDFWLRRLSKRPGITQMVIITIAVLRGKCWAILYHNIFTGNALMQILRAGNVLCHFCGNMHTVTLSPADKLTRSEPMTCNLLRMRPI